MEWLDQVWKSLHPAIQATVGSFAVVVVIGISGLVIRLIRKLALSSPEKKKEEQEKLKKHFREMEQEALALMDLYSDLSSVHGKLYINKPPERIVGLYIYFSHDEEGLLPKPSNSFTVHFPGESAELDRYRLKVDTHNRNYEEFVLKIRTAFELENIPVGRDNPKGLSPYIYDTILLPLFNWWRDREQGKANPWPNFKQVETEPDRGPYNLFVEGWGAEAIAYAKTDNDKASCKYTIDKVAQNAEYKKEAASLLKSANMLAPPGKTLYRQPEAIQQLKQKLGYVDNYWPGTKGYRFKKEKKKCPKCKEIFG